jgi:pyruvate dehydrogenase E1 component alpha subunit
MWRIRQFERHVHELYDANLARGVAHLSTGQEAVAVGAAAALQPGDRVFATYRGHHHCLARGMDPEAAFAEILGRATGVCRGKGGSMHLTDTTKGLYGSYAIVGSHLPIAAGSAWSSMLQGSGEVTVCFFGDGATTIGAFHEALNLASVWRLPVVFVCENNRYSEYTPIDRVCPVPHPAADRAPAYGLPGVVVDGNDVTAVFGTILATVGQARQGGGPSVVEAETYRHGGHSRADPATYRPRAEVEQWLARDPIARLEQELGAAGVTSDELERARVDVERELEEARARAVAAPVPRPEALDRDVFADT